MCLGLKFNFLFNCILFLLISISLSRNHYLNLLLNSLNCKIRMGKEIFTFLITDEKKSKLIYGYIS